MKTVWKNLWAKLPALPRRWKIIRNLAAAGPLLVLTLRIIGWPNVTSYGAFQRLEGELLLAPSELVLRTGRGHFSAFLTEGEGWVAVGRSDRMSSPGIPEYYTVLHHVLSKDGLIVVALPEQTEDKAMVVAVKGVPDEAVSGELEVEMNRDCISPNSYRFHELNAKETFTARAEKGENGWLFFYLEVHPWENYCLLEGIWNEMIFWNPIPEFPYRLTLLDGAGNEVERVEGTLPPDQRIQSWR